MPGANPKDSGAAVAIRGISKRYGRLTAVNNLELEVRQGEVFGFLGVNGAGKTTTIRILLDLLRPTGGRAFILGRDCQKEGLQVRSSIGYLPAEMGTYPELTGRQILDFLSGLRGQPADRKLRLQLQERFDLPDADLRRKLREYSTGMKRKLGLIQAFEADPPLLILDEPTEGLDPLMQESFYALVADTRRRGRTVFMSSHVLSEVERTCDRIALLSKGELMLLLPVEEARRMAPRSVKVFFTEDVTPPAAFPPGHEVVAASPREWDLRVEGVLGPLLRMLAALPVKDIAVEEPLEDALAKYYRGRPS
jgi:ABC-2 type transport system ATP-binding protein